MVTATTAARHAEEHGFLAADVGQRIRQARQERGMSLAQLEGEDLSRSFLSLVELGRSRVSLRALAIIAVRMGLPMSYFFDGTSVSPDLAADLVLTQAEAHLRRHEPDEVLRQLDGLEVPPTHRPRALFLHGSALIEMGHPREAVPLLQDALAAAEDQQDGAQVGELAYGLARALFAAGRPSEAQGPLQQASERARQDDPDGPFIARIQVGFGHLSYVQGDFQEAASYYDRARELYNASGDMESLAGAYTGLSRVWEKRGNLDKALHYARMSVGIYNLKHNEQAAAHELATMAEHYSALGQPEKARDCANDAVARAERLGSADVEAQARSVSAALYLHGQALEAAEHEAHRVRELVSYPHDIAAIEATVVLAKIATQRGEHAAVDSYYHEALARLKETNRFGAYADAALDYSLHLKGRGDLDDALTYALASAQGRAGAAL